MPEQTHNLPVPSFQTGEQAHAGDTSNGGESADGGGIPYAATAILIAPPGYELIEEVGQGGMGVVYRARDASLNRDVAIKLLSSKYAASSLPARRFLDEAQITGQLQHPGIPPVHEVGELADGRPFLVMKLIKGRTLNAILDEGLATRGSLIAVFEQICQAVAYAHNHGIVHRDLKPHNVMLGAFGEVQVMDWGLAKFRTTARSESAEASIASTFHDPRAEDDTDLRTRTGSFLGTPAFMSPEQAIGAVDQIDERSDVFGLGGILCAILTGQPPFVGNTGESTRQLAAQKKLADAFARLDACDAEPELINLCKRCLSAERGGRPGNAGDVARAVANLRADAEQRARQAELDRLRAEGEQAKAQAEAREQRKRRKVQLALAGAVLLMISSGGAFAWWQDKETTRQRGEAENRDREDRERLTRNGEAAAALLGQCEEALQADDAEKAGLALEQAERRATEGGADDLMAQFARCRADLDLLRELDEIETLRLTVVGGESPDAKVVAARWRTAFAGYGVAAGDTPAGQAADRLAGSLVLDRLLAALDLFLVRDTSLLGFETGESQPPNLPLDRLPVDKLLRVGRPLLQLDPSLCAWVRAVLGAADPDPYREAVRDAIVAKDKARMAELTGQAKALVQPPRFAAALGQFPAGIPAERRRGILEAALRGRPGNVTVLKALGYSYPPINHGEGADDRLRWFQAAVAARPRNVLGHMSLGQALSDMEDLDGAAASYREAIRLDPKYASSHFDLGTVLDKKGDLDGAVAAYKEAIRLSPTYNSAVYVGNTKWIRASPYSRANFYLGNTLSKKGDVDGAIAAYKEANRLGPLNYGGNPHNSLGIALLHKGDLDGAIAAFREAIRLAPNFSMGHSNLGYALQAKGDLDGAIAACKEAIRVDPKNHHALSKLGNALQAKGDLDGANAAFKEAIRLDPNDSEAHHCLGDALQFHKHDSVAAAAAYREAIRLRPKYAWSHNNLGTALRSTGDLDGAIVEFREAVRLDPKHDAAINNLTAALTAKGDLDGVIAMLREKIRRDPTNAKIHAALGNALRDKKDLDGAIAEYKEAVRLDSKFALAHINLGDALKGKRNWDGAIAAYWAAILLNPSDEYVPPQMRDCYAAKGDIDGAVKAAREAVRLFPKVFATHNGLGDTLQFLQKDSVAAAAAYREAIRLNPIHAWSHSNLGTALRNTGDLDGAIAEFREAIHLDPKHAHALDNLTKALISKGDLDGATAVLREKVRLDPTNAEVRAALGEALRSKKDLDGAIAACKEAIRLDPKNFGAHAGLGHALYEKKDLDGAIASYKEASRFNQKEPHVRYMLGVALRDKGALDESIASFREAIRLDPKRGYFHNGLGDALKVKGDLVGAVANFREAIRLDPKNGHARYLLARLLATGPDWLRDGRRAVELATRACELSDWKFAGYIDTLAAAYAEVGQFDMAIEYQKKALAVSFPAWAQGEGKDARARLELYTQKKPYRASTLAMPPPEQGPRPREVKR